MKIIVKLHGIIRKTNKVNANEITLNFSDNLKVTDVLRILIIPLQEVGLVVVNGVCCSKDHLLNPNDVVDLFPPIAGG